MSPDSTLPDRPPTSPKPSAKDREIFTKRVKARISELGTSGRRLEERILMARGTLSKIYSGRLALSAKTLREIAGELQVGPDHLVDGTTFSHLLQVAPATPDSEALSEARKLIDDLRLELVGTLANNKALTDELATANEQLKEARARTDELTTQLRQSEADRHTAAQELQQEIEARRELQGTLDETRVHRDQLQRKLEAERQRVASASQKLSEWRKFGEERAERVKMLESELQETLKKLNAEESIGWAKTLAGSLLGLGLGAVAASPSQDHLLAQYRRRS